MQVQAADPGTDLIEFQSYLDTNAAIAPDEFDDRHMEIQGVRGLFCAVITENWKTAFDGRANDPWFDVHQSRSWFGSKGFQEVCDLAGVCSRSIYDQYVKRAMREPWGQHG